MRNKQERICLFDLTYIHVSRRSCSINLYSFRLLRALTERYSDRFILIVTEQNKEYVTEMFPQFKYVTYIPYDGIFAHRRFFHSRMEKCKFRKFVNSMHCDCFFSAASINNKITLKYTLRKVVVLHDIKIITYGWKGNCLKEMLWRCRMLSYYRNLINNSSVTVAVSDFTRQDILDNIPGVKESRLRVIYNSVVVADHSEPVENLPDNGYILYVNTFSPHKNFITLLKAFILISQSVDKDLVVVADRNDHFANREDCWNLEFLPLLKANGLENRVHLFNNVSDSQLRYLYERADLFVSPSLYEGFGYTPLEAAICGCPVLCTKCTALPDTTRGKLNYYDNPLDEVELSECILRLLTKGKDREKLKALSDYFKNCYSLQKQRDEILEVLDME